KRTYPLMSSFKPTNNMTVNLLEAFGRKRAREVLETSFAQFQADRSVVGLARGVRDKQMTLDGYAEAMSCHLGDFAEYAAMRREISDLERVLASGRVRADRGKQIRISDSRRATEKNLNELKQRIKHHPCHSCPDREAHSRWGERWHKLSREIEQVVNQVERHTNQVARTFDRICDLLLELDYLREDGDDLEVLESGKTLARIYGERDLLVSECLREGLWKNLDPAGLAAMAAALVYEGRRDDEHFETKLPKGNFSEILEQTEELLEELGDLARSHKLPGPSELQPSLCLPIHRWATGAKLDTVLAQADLLPGDFIRWSKQIIDMLDQISQVADPQISYTAKQAVDKVKRGIVAYSYYG
ncbi:MAG: RNA helicase, partial [Micrococcales bacterium]